MRTSRDHTSCAVYRLAWRPKEAAIPAEQVWDAVFETAAAALANPEPDLESKNTYSTEVFRRVTKEEGRLESSPRATVRFVALQRVPDGKGWSGIVSYASDALPKAGSEDSRSGRQEVNQLPEAHLPCVSVHFVVVFQPGRDAWLAIERHSVISKLVFQRLLDTCAKAAFPRAGLRVDSSAHKSDELETALKTGQLDGLVLRKNYKGTTKRAFDVRGSEVVEEKVKIKLEVEAQPDGSPNIVKWCKRAYEVFRKGRGQGFEAATVTYRVDGKRKTAALDWSEPVDDDEDSSQLMAWATCAFDVHSIEPALDQVAVNIHASLATRIHAKLMTLVEREVAL